MTLNALKRVSFEKNHPHYFMGTEWASILIFTHSTHTGPFLSYPTQLDYWLGISIIPWYLTLKILMFSTYMFTFHIFDSYSIIFELLDPTRKHLILAMTRAQLIWYSFTPYYSLIVNRGPDDAIASFCHFRTCTLKQQKHLKTVLCTCDFKICIC